VLLSINFLEFLFLFLPIFIYILYKLFKLLSILYKRIFLYIKVDNFKIYIENLSLKDIKFIIDNCHYYNKLNDKNKKKFLKRIDKIIDDFVIHYIENKDEQNNLKLRLSMLQTKLTFGLNCYNLEKFDNIMMYPDEFTSFYTGEKNIGETNPGLRTIAIAKDDFLDGINYKNDNLNLGIHELSHALFYTMDKKDGYCATKFIFAYDRLMKTVEKYKDDILNDDYFRKYMFNTDYEIFPVLSEHFFETPKEFKNRYPEIYDKMCKVLNQNLADL